MRIQHTKAAKTKLREIVYFDPKILTNANDDIDINTAINAVVPLLKGKHIKLEIEKECLQKLVVEELVSKLFKKITSSIVLEKNHSEWLSEEFNECNDITIDYIGLGCNRTTWYGTPDARLRGFYTDCNVLLSHDDDDDDSPESDGGSMLMEVKRKYQRSSQAIGTAVLSSFTEHKLHPSQNSLVPTILINCYTAEIYLYDCVSDKLLISESVKIKTTDDRVTKSGILFLWLFINHRYVSS